MNAHLGSFAGGKEMPQRLALSSVFFLRLRVKIRAYGYATARRRAAHAARRGPTEAASHEWRHPDPIVQANQ